MNTDTKTIDNIMTVPAIKRRKLRSDVERHATAQCNGDYYYNDDTEQWEGEQSHKAAKMEQSIIKRIHMYSAGIIGVVTGIYSKKDLPDFITYENDPRGFVLKIESEKLSDEAKQYCRDSHLEMDWGGDYTILTNQEWK